MLFKKIRVPQLETERLILRPWAGKDAADLFEYAQDPEVGPNAGWAPHRDLGESCGVINNFYKKSMTWAIQEKETGKVVGNVMLENDPYRPAVASKEIGYSLARTRWGKGYMPEAVKRVISYTFDVLNVDVIMLRTADDNLKSQRVAEKCGFTYEGTLRHSFRTYNGQIREVRCYSLLKNEYK